jgi:hypothetical protein
MHLLRQQRLIQLKFALLLKGLQSPHFQGHFQRALETNLEFLLNNLISLEFLHNKLVSLGAHLLLDLCPPHNRNHNKAPSPQPFENTSVDVDPRQRC